MNGANGVVPKRKRNFSNRTKTGCLTCRRRKKKCDEERPLCEYTSCFAFPTNLVQATIAIEAGLSAKAIRRHEVVFGLKLLQPKYPCRYSPKTALPTRTTTHTITA